MTLVVVWGKRKEPENRHGLRKNKQTDTREEVNKYTDLNIVFQRMLQETSLLKRQQLLQETRFYFRSTMEFTPSIVKKNKGSNRLNKTCMKILLLSKKKSTHPIYHKNLLKNVMCTLQLSAQNTLYRSTHTAACTWRNTMVALKENLQNTKTATYMYV